MKFTPTKISDVIICEPTVFKDNRGYFAEVFRQDKLEDFIGSEICFCQENESSSYFGVLRGLHYQLAPYSQTKLVRVVQGRVLDVVVDIRENSATFGQHISIELTAENKKQLFIPKGFAHGFVVLSNKAIFTYKVDTYYHPKYDRGIVFNDEKLNIDWKLSSEEIQLSQKDKHLPTFLETEYFDIKTKLSN